MASVAAAAVSAAGVSVRAADAFGAALFLFIYVSGRKAYDGGNGRECDQIDHGVLLS